MWTKQDIVQEAFGELALQGFVFNVGPEELASALRRLDILMATWKLKGIDMLYNAPLSPSDGTQLPDDSGLADGYVEAVVLELAKRICANFGKTPPQSTMITAKAAYDAVLIGFAQPKQQQFPSTLPRGAGNKPWRWTQYATFFTPCNEAPNPCSTETTINTP